MAVTADHIRDKIIKELAAVHVVCFCFSVSHLYYMFFKMNLCTVVTTQFIPTVSYCFMCQSPCLILEAAGWLIHHCTIRLLLLLLVQEGLPQIVAPLATTEQPLFVADASYLARVLRQSLTKISVTQQQQENELTDGC